MKATRMSVSLSAVAALALALAPIGSADAQQDKQNNQNWVFGSSGLTTGLWNFDNPGNRYAASSALECGEDGSIWVSPVFIPPRELFANLLTLAREDLPPATHAMRDTYQLPGIVTNGYFAAPGLLLPLQV